MRAPLESLLEELRERDSLLARAQLAPAPAPRGGGAAARAPLGKPPKKRTTAEQWALVAASDAELVAGVRAHQRALYGEDGRFEQRGAPAEVRALGASVAALFARRDLVEVGGRFHVMTRPLAEVLCLAPGEAFAEQPCGAFGTAWVLDEHHMVTAGGCLPRGGVDELVCVFGFAVGLQGDVPDSFSAEQVAFPSAALSSRELGEDGDADWAILRFEQALAAAPLRLRTGAVEIGEAVWMFGHPCGLPLKYAPGAVVTRHKNEDRFLATLDAFAGNSGSPVFDAQRRVVGMLVRGAEDWPQGLDGPMTGPSPKVAPRAAAVGAPSEARSLGEEVMKLGRFIARRPAVRSAPRDEGAPPLPQRPAMTRRSASGSVASSLTPGAAPGRRRRFATTERLALPLDARALIIQISSYPEMPIPLVRDADELAALLADPELGHYPPEHVTVLRDAQATRAGILAAVRALAAAAGEGSTIFFYFSGHAGQRGETTYLLPFDCDPEALARTAISTRELREALSALPTEQALLVFDCCHVASRAGHELGEGAEASARAVLPGLTEAAAEELVRARGWALVASSHPGQRSAVRPGARTSVFGRHLLDGLRGGRPSDDGYVRVFELYEYLQPRLVAEEPEQRPMWKGAPAASFELARHRGGAVAAVPRTDDGFLYHALLCFAKADAPRVRGELAPALLAAGLRVATTSELAMPGVEHVIGLERGLLRARRTLLVVSQAFLHPDRESDREMERELGVLQRRETELRNGRYSVVPIYVEDRDLLREVPAWLANLREVPLSDAADSHPGGNVELERLIQELRSSLPRR